MIPIEKSLFWKEYSSPITIDKIILHSLHVSRLHNYPHVGGVRLQIGSHHDEVGCPDNSIFQPMPHNCIKILSMSSPHRKDMMPSIFSDDPWKCVIDYSFFDIPYQLTCKVMMLFSVTDFSMDLLLRGLMEDCIMIPRATSRTMTYTGTTMLSWRTTQITGTAIKTYLWRLSTARIIDRGDGGAMISIHIVPLRSTLNDIFIKYNNIHAFSFIVQFRI